MTRSSELHTLQGTALLCRGFHPPYGTQKKSCVLWAAEHHRYRERTCRPYALGGVHKIHTDLGRWYFDLSVWWNHRRISPELLRCVLLRPFPHPQRSSTFLQCTNDKQLWYKNARKSSCLWTGHNSIKVYRARGEQGHCTRVYRRPAGLGRSVCVKKTVRCGKTKFTIASWCFFFFVRKRPKASKT